MLGVDILGGSRVSMDDDPVGAQIFLHRWISRRSMTMALIKIKNSPKDKFFDIVTEWHVSQSFK